jgi:hypothetical protein
VFGLAFESVYKNDMSHMGSRLALEQSCRFDPWTKSLVEHYGDDIKSEAAVVDVLTRAMHIEVDNVRREAKHSSIRRHVVRASCQSRTIGLELTSGRFVDGRLRQWERSLSRASSRDPSAGDASACPGEPAAK